MTRWVYVLIGLLLGLVIGRTWPADRRSGASRVTLEDNSEHRVTRVVDGDTIQLENGMRVRYIAVDTPEMGTWRDDRKPEPFAQAATEANRRMVEGKMIRLKLGPRPIDQYGRVLARVFVQDGSSETDVGMKLLQEGLGNAISRDLNTVNYHEAKRAEAAARAARRGKWGQGQ